MLVCHCAAVYDERIRDVIAAGARDLATVAGACGAGSFCGGCRPTVATMLARATGQPLAAFTIGERLSARLGTRPQATVHEIEQDLAAAGWPVGQPVGGIGEIADRYGVTERTAWDAVATARHHGFLTGPPEALRAGEPSLAAVARAVAMYLDFTGVGLDELVDARRTLEAATVQRAGDAVVDPARGRAGDLSTPRPPSDTPARPTDASLAWHTALAARTGNPIFGVFVETLIRLMRDYVDPGALDPGERRRLGARLDRAHAAIDRALASGRLDEATALLVEHIGEFYDRLPATRWRRAGGAGDKTRNRVEVEKDVGNHVGEDVGNHVGEDVGNHVGNRVAQVARALVDDIRVRGVPPGRVIGSQADVARRHGVDRAVLGEAIGLLEYYSIAQLQRGRGGGLVVSPAEPWAVAQLLALYLEYVGADPRQVLEVRHALELRSAELAAERIGMDGVDRLRRRLEAERGTQEHNLVGFHNVHPLIAELSGNRVIALFAGALTLTVLRQVERRGLLAAGAPVLDAETTAAHAAIVEAIVAGDADLARRRMLEHIDRHGRVGADGR